MFPLRSGIAAEQQVPGQLQVWWVSDGGNWANGPVPGS